ncbi:MAG: EAL domain-containing protein, partial [Campylobacterales bacterium]|nr:EAL domain-containing protein [Campylobacterales bacterium]
MKLTTLQSLVSTKTASLYPTDTISRAMEAMKHHSISSVVIIDEAERPVGIFTERDALRAVANETDTATSLEGVMSPDPFCVPGSVQMHDAYLSMEEKGFRHLIVVDDAGKFAGVVSEGDFIRHIGFEQLSKFKTVAEAMNGSPLIITPDMSLKEAAALMSERRCDYAVVLEGSSPSGIVTERDIAHHYTQSDAAFTEKIERLLRDDIRTVDRSLSLQEAALVMEQHGVHQLIVVDGSGNLAGLLNRHDVLRAVHGAYFEFLIRTIERKSAAMAKINERKRELRSEKEGIEQSTLKIRKLFETLPDGIVLVDTATMRAVEFNRAAYEQLGYTAEEFAALAVSEIEAVESVEETRSHIETILKTGHDSFESLHRTKEGVLIDVWVNAVVIDLGGIPYVMAVYRDITERKRKDREINRVQSLAHIGTLEWDILKDEFCGSEESSRIFGIAFSEKPSIVAVLGRVIEEDRARVETELAQAMQEGVYDAMCRIDRGNGDIRWVQTSAEFVYDDKGRAIKGIGVVQDFTERVRHEEELRRKDADLGAAQALAHIGSWRLDVAKNVLEWSDETYRIFGIEIGTPLDYGMFLSTIHPDDLEKVDYAWKAALNGAAYEVEHRILVGGELKWVRENARLETDSTGNLVAGVGTVQLITERKLYEERLETLANYDPLTGLANRALLMSHLQNSIDQARRTKSQIALIMFDLDRFKDINDSYGHGAGDELLRLVASRFTSRLREGDLIGRLGGDEFAVVLENFSVPEDAGRLAKEMIETLGMEYKLSGGALIHIGASAGIALFPNHGEDAHMLLQHADAALYKSKSEGRGTYFYYTDELTESARKRIECETRLRRAIVNNEFEVYYQPQVHLGTGRIVGAEALVRWNDPVRGRISPAEFIPVAEETGLIREIGEWVLNEVCRQGKIWLDRGHRLTLAVNLSAHQVRHQNIPKMVESALKASGFTASRLELELTESALMERQEEAVAMLHALRAHGIRLAIDDFGTGYSSLSYLKRFPIDVLKIDKSFIDDIPYDQDDMAIVSAIIAMGEALGFQILAEGTEREEQIEFLRSKGCTMYQG